MHVAHCIPCVLSLHSFLLKIIIHKNILSLSRRLQQYKQYSKRRSYEDDNFFKEQSHVIKNMHGIYTWVAEKVRKVREGKTHEVEGVGGRESTQGKGGKDARGRGGCKWFRIRRRRAEWKGHTLHPTRQITF